MDDNNNLVLTSVDAVKVIDWDDGHKPGGTQVPTKMAINTKLKHNFFNVIDKFLEEVWCERIYQYAVERRRPWGVYITKEEVFRSELGCEGLWAQDDKEKAIGLYTVRRYYSSSGLEFLAQDTLIHGCAVWCLSSGITNSVEYHIDYAELYRYETNIIHPPIYAGTAHVSPISSNSAHGKITGGDFSANLDGLAHYKTFGYKGLLKSKDEFQNDFESSNWVHVKYQYNRAMIHDGDYPHLSTPVRDIQPETLKRVILGFNFFSSEVGESCIRAPEHSDAFNRTVKLYQMVSKLSGGSVDVGKYSNTTSPHKSQSSTATSVKSSSSRITPKDVMKNPALAKLLVAASKKIKSVREAEAQLEASKIVS